MIRATIGILAGQGGFDADAQAFFDRVTTAGGTLSSTEQDAVNTLVLQMKADGIWSKMKAIYPMVGASAAACAQNLKSSSFTGSFTSGWTFASTGVTPNGTNAYATTGFVPSVEISNAANLFFGGYVFNNTSKEGPLMSANSSSAFNELWPRQGAGNYYAIYGTSVGSGSTNSDSRGFYLVKKVTSSTATQGWKNNNVHYTNSTSQSNTLSTNQFYLALRNGTTAYSDKTTSFIFIGEGILTNTEVSDFYDAVQAFQTTLSRQV